MHCGCSLFRLCFGCAPQTICRCAHLNRCPRIGCSHHCRRTVAGQLCLHIGCPCMLSVVPNVLLDSDMSRKGKHLHRRCLPWAQRQALRRSGCAAQAPHGAQPLGPARWPPCSRLSRLRRLVRPRACLRLCVLPRQPSSASGVHERAMPAGALHTAKGPTSAKQHTSASALLHACFAWVVIACPVAVSSDEQAYGWQHA